MICVRVNRDPVKSRHQFIEQHRLFEFFPANVTVDVAEGRHQGNGDVSDPKGKDGFHIKGRSILRTKYQMPRAKKFQIPN